MSSPPWMPLYVADYLADTGHLNVQQHGAYLLLIMHYWRTGYLPTDDESLSRIARCDKRLWSKIMPVISQFFNKGWKHPRVDYELHLADKTISKRSAAGKIAVAAREARRSSFDHRIDNETISPSQSPSPSPIQEEDSVASQQAQAPVLGPLSFKRLVFSVGGQFLVSSGVTERDARAMLGKWRKQYGDAEIMNALAVADGSAVSEPIPYIQSILTGKAKQNGHGRADNHPLGQFGWLLEKYREPDKAEDAGGND